MALVNGPLGWNLYGKEVFMGGKPEVGAWFEITVEVVPPGQEGMACWPPLPEGIVVGTVGRPSSLRDGRASVVRSSINGWQVVLEGEVPRPSEFSRGEKVAFQGKVELTPEGRVLIPGGHSSFLVEGLGDLIGPFFPKGVVLDESGILIHSLARRMVARTVFDILSLLTARFSLGNGILRKKPSGLVACGLKRVSVEERLGSLI